MEHITRKDFIKDLRKSYGFSKKYAKAISKQLDFDTEYEGVEDYQGCNLGIGRIETEPEWLITAMEWEDLDDFVDDDNFWLDITKDHKLISWIEDMWEIGIKKI